MANGVITNPTPITCLVALHKGLGRGHGHGHMSVRNMRGCPTRLRRTLLSFFCIGGAGPASRGNCALLAECEQQLNEGVSPCLDSGLLLRFVKVPLGHTGVFSFVDQLRDFEGLQVCLPALHMLLHQLEQHITWISRVYRSVNDNAVDSFVFCVLNEL
jgi:hypothetical protein